MNSEKNIEVLNSLLQGEVSAAETYSQALKDLTDEPKADQLYFIKAEHYEAVRDISKKIRAMGGKPEVESGAWGTWAKVVLGSAKVFGDSAALQALKQGEKHGLKQYQEVSKDPEVDIEIKAMVDLRLIPQQKRHLRTVDSIMQRL